MSRPNCYVCDAPLGALLYSSEGGRSLTSLCQIHPTPTLVQACDSCGHVQSGVLSDVDAFYDDDYDILVGSDEEDQIYEVVDGQPVYRTQHQVRTLLGKLSLPDGANLLDYGCAKSSTIRMLCEQGAGITPHLFDVSERYIPFWRKFAQPGNWSVYTTPPEWDEKFDVVTSFFSLEHIPALSSTMRHVARLLKPDGTFYAIVPNVTTNIADLIVVDHCNHFTRPSLERLVRDCGLQVLEVDDRSHRGAFVVVARKPVAGSQASAAATGDVGDTLRDMAGIGEFWRGAAARVREFESTLPSDEGIAIYGAGFYGAFIASCLASPERVRCHLDQNPFLQGGMFDGRPVLPPAELPADVSTMLVGLNPANARRIIADIPALSGRDLRYFYL